MDQEKTEDLGNQVKTDPWAAAFAALGAQDEKVSEEPSDAGGYGDGVVADAEAADGALELPDQAGTAYGAGGEGERDEPGSAPGEPGVENLGTPAGLFGVAEEDFEQYESRRSERLRDRTVNEIAQEFVKRGVRNSNGKLGATINDKDICRRDEDGVPRFFNPETGHEFSGDNPRRQAQEWVDDYNKDLARVFNEACAKYERHLREESEPAAAVVRFAPKYAKLDEVRRGMFEDIIQDYEVRDSEGNLVGYSCDLDKALATVDRQVARIQQYAKSRQPKEQPGGPALDMKASGGSTETGGLEPPKSLAEAMERIQNEQLKKLRG